MKEKICKNCDYWLRVPNMEKKKIHKNWAYCYNGSVGMFSVLFFDLNYNEIESGRALFNQDFGCIYWKKRTK